MSSNTGNACFFLLCVSAPGFLALNAYQLVSGASSSHAFAQLGALVGAILFIWSFATVRQYPKRAVCGILTFVLVIWLMVVLPAYIEWQRRNGRPSTHSLFIEACRETVTT